MPTTMMHPDRLFPSDPHTRDIARELYLTVADAPICSPHGHVSASMLADDAPFASPTELLVTGDHYVTRVLHGAGVPLGTVQAPAGEPAVDPREAWRVLASHWHLFRATPVQYWLEYQLGEVFGVTTRLSAETADAVYDEIAERLTDDAYRPRALFERFGVDVLATTDDPADDLAAHRTLAADPDFHGRVLPTFRADRIMDPSAPGWLPSLDRLAAASGIPCGTHAGLLDALRDRRAFFRSVGGTSTDTGVADSWASPLDSAEAERIHVAGLRGRATAAEGVAYRRDILYRLIEMSAEDGMVMQLHPGVHRNHHAPTLERHGADTGHDLPLPTTFTEPLRRALNDFGTGTALRLVLFTVDETAFSRELAPLAGFYPSVYVGAPWWFLDTPDAMERYRRAITDSAGFSKTSGFIDDTRAFCSIPARHDMARRADAAYLASLVATHRLTEADAADIALDLVQRIPYDTFRIPR
ncbi:glucuronate isomerase [Microbacterium sp. SD291]|uniref:glucuronate isomerase n=1 Tax=Microbacterium sp. SD291 TaxID=2782007 RepID=UPI001A96A91A|nr:glucuronate isomerase [Microbacterium sp. SD291]MBO0979723.1 glucuronate isomerase [Microbacterium sp. SD291]